MLNFLLGATAGGAVAVVALAVGLRQPAVLERLDLAPRSNPAVPLVRRSEPACPPPSATGAVTAGAMPTDSLFTPRRFWFVAP